jgi:scyllo-inositol 2-dehydrogenase (NAD+)
MVHAHNFRWRVPHAELMAIVDVDGERAKEAAAELALEGAGYADLASALASTDLDAVVITTPTFTHAELAVHAARAGKHVLCEKPMALTLEECDAMMAAAKEAGVVLQLAFMRHFDPPFVAAKAQIDAGLIGRPLIVRSLTRGPGLPPDWANDIKTGNGMLAEVNSHDFDTVRWLGGGNYTEVYAQASALKAPHLKERFPDFYDTAVVSLKLDNGAYGMIDGVCPVDYGYDARAEVVGSEGVLFIGELRDMATTRVTREGGMVEAHYLSWRERFREAYVAEAEHFVGCVLEGKTPSVGGEDGRRAVEIVLAANASIRSGAPVKLGPLVEARPECHSASLS